MKKLIYSVVISLAGAGMAFAAIPPLTVVVSDSAGKVAYKNSISAKGSFATGALKPGEYVVQFQSKGADTKGTYALVVSAGVKKVTADSVDGAKFAAGGIAMKINVGSGLNITGQVSDAVKTMVDKNGKKMVWIPKKLGSNLPAHWAAADSPEAKEAMTQGSYSTKNIMDKQAQGISPH